MKIKAYLKPNCRWSVGVRTIMEKYKLDYEDVDILNNPYFHLEMIKMSKQKLSPCIEINNYILFNFSNKEFELYLSIRSFTDYSFKNKSVCTENLQKTFVCLGLLKKKINIFFH